MNRWGIALTVIGFVIFFGTIFIPLFAPEAVKPLEPLLCPNGKLLNTQSGFSAPTSSGTRVVFYCEDVEGQRTNVTFRMLAYGIVPGLIIFFAGMYLITIKPEQARMMASKQ
jgi:hypothetical protein